MMGMSYDFWAQSAPILIEQWNGIDVYFDETGYFAYMDDGTKYGPDPSRDEIRKAIDVDLAWMENLNVKG